MSVIIFFLAEGDPLNYLGPSLQKVYVRTLGDREYNMFEAVFVGLRRHTMLMRESSGSVLFGTCLSSSFTVSMR